MRRYLQRRDFGFLQNSVWISPDPLEEERDILTGGMVNVESLILLEARTIAGESSEQIVVGAWDFDEINERYSRYLKILAARPRRIPNDKTSAIKFFQWLSQEGRSWLDAVNKDPLLPNRLLPPNYLGQKAWQRRVKAMKEAATSGPG